MTNKQILQNAKYEALEKEVVLELAEAMHNKYEELSKEKGWKTQEVTRVKFKDLPEENKQVMLGLVEWLFEYLDL